MKITSKGGTFIADLRLSPDGKVYIVELGDGCNSSFDGYDSLPGQQQTMRQLTREKLCESGVRILSDLSLLDDLYGAKQQGLFDHRCDPHREKLDITVVSYPCDLESELSPDLQTLTDKQTIVLTYETSAQNAASCAIRMNKIYELNPHPPIFMMGHNTFLPAIRDKFAYSELARLSGFTLKPQDTLANLSYENLDAIESKLAGIPGDYVVIKPMSESGGTGIMILPKSQASAVIRHLKERTEMPTLDPVNKEAYTFWQKLLIAEKDSAFMLLQQYIPNQPITVGQETFNPTARVVFYVYYDDKGEQHLKIVDGYWKLPRQSLSGTAAPATTSSAVSHIHDDTTGKTNSAAITPQQLAAITQQLEQGLPVLLDTIFSVDATEFLLSLVFSNDDIKSAYAIKYLANYELGDISQLLHTLSVVMAIHQQDARTMEKTGNLIVSLIKSPSFLDNPKNCPLIMDFLESRFANFPSETKQKILLSLIEKAYQRRDFFSEKAKLPQNAQQFIIYHNRSLNRDCFSLLSPNADKIYAYFQKELLHQATAAPSGMPAPATTPLSLSLPFFNQAGPNPQIAAAAPPASGAAPSATPASLR